MRRNHGQFAAPLALIFATCACAADLHIGYSERPACDYREGFHVPAPLRKEGAPFEWGVLKIETPVRLRVQEMASTERAHPGDRIDLEVIEEVRVEGFTVIRKGAEAWATVEAASQRPGARAEWLLYDPYIPPAPAGQQREFPIYRITDGKLSFQVQGAYDITGGHVSLYAANIIGAGDSPAALEFDSGTVLIWQALRYPIEKVSGKKMPSIAGRQAVLSKGAEITALVDGAVCYDLAFLKRVEEVSEPRLKLEHATAR